MNLRATVNGQGKTYTILASLVAAAVSLSFLLGPFIHDRLSVEGRISKIETKIESLEKQMDRNQAELVKRLEDLDRKLDRGRR